MLFALLITACILLSGIAIATALGWRESRSPAPEPIPLTNAVQGRSDQALSPLATRALDATQPPARPVFRHSVVPGGVHTAAEVARAIASDPVVAKHYAGVDAPRLRSERLAQPLTAHVSYRIGDRVFWTRNKLRLAAGEHVLTDGTTTLRARCGNMISTVRRTPVFAGEPEEAEFEVTVDPIDLAFAPDAVVFRPTLEGEPSTMPYRRAVEIPSPSTLVLVAFAVASGIGAILFGRRKLD